MTIDKHPDSELVATLLADFLQTRVALGHDIVEALASGTPAKWELVYDCRTFKVARTTSPFIASTPTN